MASSSQQNNDAQPSSTGMEIVLWVPKPISINDETSIIISEGFQATGRKNKLATARILDVAKASFKVVNLQGGKTDYKLEMNESGQQNQAPANVVVNSGTILSLAQRLDGWEVERRIRPDGIIDKFYRHCQSNKLFRTLPEVKRFISDGSTPKRKRSEEPEKDVTKFLAKAWNNLLNSKRITRDE